MLVVIARWSQSLSLSLSLAIAMGKKAPIQLLGRLQGHHAYRDGGRPRDDEFGGDEEDEDDNQPAPQSIDGVRGGGGGGGRPIPVEETGYDEAHVILDGQGQRVGIGESCVQLTYHSQ